MNEKILYKEDVAGELRCTDKTALLIMKRSGAAFKIGKRYAIPCAALTMIMSGCKTPALQKYGNIEYR